MTICVGESIVKFALTHKYVYHLEPLQRDFVLTVFPHIVTHRELKLDGAIGHFPEPL